MVREGCGERCTGETGATTGVPELRGVIVHLKWPVLTRFVHDEVRKHLRPLNSDYEPFHSRTMSLEHTCLPSLDGPSVHCLPPFEGKKLISMLSKKDVLTLENCH
jgi:hypothetical protein